jgi:hypothetical protein
MLWYSFRRCFCWFLLPKILNLLSPDVVVGERNLFHTLAADSKLSPDLHHHGRRGFSSIYPSLGCKSWLPRKWMRHNMHSEMKDPMSSQVDILLHYHEEPRLLPSQWHRSFLKSFQIDVGVHLRRESTPKEALHSPTDLDPRTEL